MEERKNILFQNGILVLVGLAFMSIFLYHNPPNPSSMSSSSSSSLKIMKIEGVLYPIE